MRLDFSHHCSAFDRLFSSVNSSPHVSLASRPSLRLMEGGSEPRGLSPDVRLVTPCSMSGVFFFPPVPLILFESSDWLIAEFPRRNSLSHLPLPSFLVIPPSFCSRPSFRRPADFFLSWSMRMAADRASASLFLSGVHGPRTLLNVPLYPLHPECPIIISACLGLSLVGLNKSYPLD